MATFKGIIFANRNAFENKQNAVFNYIKANNKSLDLSVVKCWSKGINSLTTNEVLMPLDERLNDFPWSPEQVVEISKNDSKWFNDAL